MCGQDSTDVTLVYADPALLLCWEEKVKQGVECSLHLKYSKGKFTSTLQCSSTKDIPELGPSSTSQAEKIKKKKKGSKKKLEALINYQKHLVAEKGLPPSRLMVEQAASATSPYLPVQMPGLKENEFKCEHCEKCFNSLRGLKTHMGHIHRDIQKPEQARHEELNISLEASLAIEDRDEDPHPEANSAIISISETPVPAVDPCPLCKGS